MEASGPTCYRHPDRRAGVRCQRCERPICPDCMHQASVGFHCPECTRAGAQKVVRTPSLSARGNVVTTALIALNVAIDVWGIGSGGATRNQVIVDGAIAGPLVADGEWYRIITSGFLHENLIHIGLNMWVLYQLGMLMEPVLGRFRFGLVYAVSLLSGSFGVLLLQPNTLAVGASGAIFGLMGAAVAALRSRGINPFHTGVGTAVMLNLLITFTIPGISIGGHVGGLVGGFLAGWILTDLAPRLKDDVVPVGVVALLGLAVAAGCVLVA
jgi:membrane associated rhomboid family serine protease